MAEDVQVKFEEAAARAQNLPQRPDNATMLKLYSLYKQGTAGDVSGKRPGFTDFVGRAKYDAWAKCRGQSSEEAKLAYIKLVEELEAG